MAAVFNKPLLRTFNLLLLVTIISTTFAPATAATFPPDPRFGAVESYMAPDAATAINVGWDRMIFHWHKRQPNTAEEWNVSGEETGRIAKAQETGREVVGLLIGTPTWATDGGFATGVPRGLYQPVDDPANLWAAFVHRIVAENAGKVGHWIIWNEPDIAAGDYGLQFEGTVEDYYQLLKVAYLAAKQANPDAVIHMAGLTYWHDIVYERPPYLQRLLEVARKDNTAYKNGYYFDALSLHIYFRTETVPEIVNFYNRILRRYGLKKAVWINELNAAPNDDPTQLASPIVPVSMDEQASFIIQTNALALALGVERIAVYKLIDEGLSAGYEPYGLFREDGTPRPAAEAYRTVTTHFAGTQSATYLTRYNNYVVTLNRGALTTTVLWSRVGKDVPVTLRATRNTTAVLYDHYGLATEIVPDTRGNYALTLPAANCTGPYGCAVGGAPWILVETAIQPTPTAVPVVLLATPAVVATP
jgi:Glycosyl hydrolase catalytic core